MRQTKLLCVWRKNMDENQEAILRTIAEYRILTMRQLAEKSGIEYTYCGWLCGRPDGKQPTFYTLVDLGYVTVEKQDINSRDVSVVSVTKKGIQKASKL
jgi:hypothetical protein